MATVYVVWDRKNLNLCPGTHPDVGSANAAIAKRKLKDRGPDTGKAYDAIQVNI